MIADSTVITAEKTLEHPIGAGLAGTFRFRIDSARETVRQIRLIPLIVVAGELSVCSEQSLVFEGALNPCS